MCWWPGYPVDDAVAAESEGANRRQAILFSGRGTQVASTLDAEAEAGRLAMRRLGAGWHTNRLDVDGTTYAVIGSALRDMRGAAAGRDSDCAAVRAACSGALAALERNLILTWLAAILAGLGRQLSAGAAGAGSGEASGPGGRAASRARSTTRACRSPARMNWAGWRRRSTRCASPFKRRGEELIRQERISTIGRFPRSIVHDLRNPLAAIYGGAEMLMDGELNEVASAAAGGEHLSVVAGGEGSAAGVGGRFAPAHPAGRGVPLAGGD